MEEFRSPSSPVLSASSFLLILCFGPQSALSGPCLHKARRKAGELPPTPTSFSMVAWGLCSDLPLTRPSLEGGLGQLTPNSASVKAPRCASNPDWPAPERGPRRGPLSPVLCREGAGLSQDHTSVGKPDQGSCHPDPVHCARSRLREPGERSRGSPRPQL